MAPQIVPQLVRKICLRCSLQMFASFNFTNLEVLGIKMAVAQQAEEIIRLRRLANLTDQFRDIRQDVQENAERLEGLGSDATDLEEDVRARLDTQFGRLNNAELYSREVNRQVQELKSTVATQAADIRNLKEMNEEKDQQIMDLMDLVQAQGQQIQAALNVTGSFAQSQRSQDARIDSLVQNSTADSFAIRQRVDKIDATLDEAFSSVKTDVEALAILLEQAVADQMSREELIHANISVIANNVSQTAAYVENIYAELVLSVGSVLNTVRAQEEALLQLANDTAAGQQAVSDAVARLVAAGGAGGAAAGDDDVASLRAMVALQQELLANLSTSTRLDLSQIEQRFSSSLLLLNETFQRELANVEISMRAGLSRNTSSSPDNEEIIQQQQIGNLNAVSAEHKLCFLSFVQRNACRFGAVRKLLKCDDSLTNFEKTFVNNTMLLQINWSRP